LNKDIQTIFLTGTDIRHIKKKHGSNEAARGQVDVTPDDFALIPLVLNEFDKVEHELTDKMGYKKLLFQKKCEGLIYLAAVERGEYKMEIRTFWKMRVPGASC
jgi:tmRNA-binding protein